MRYRRIGKSGIKISELSFGAWVTFGSQVGEDVALECMTAAYEAGVNFFDNAEAYAGGKAETVMGNVLKKTGWRREGLVISTKVFWGGEGPNDKGLSHKHIIEGVNAALKRLQVEYVDLAFCHRPDPETPIEETVRAMDVLVRQGKVFYWGTSEWSAADIMRAHGIAMEHGLTPPRMEQPQYNMLWRKRVEAELQPVYRELGYGTTIWSPLASGLLSGKYSDAPASSGRLDLPSYKWLREMVVTPERLASIDKLKPLASDLGCTLAQLAIAWCTKNPNVSTVITGASHVKQVKENMKAVDVAKKLTSEVMEKIEKILNNKPDESSG
jgi:voltage-dependent potassium channel beta subunit